MGIDLHFGDHAVSFHLPVVALIVLAVIALYGVWKVYLIVVSALRG